MTHTARPTQRVTPYSGERRQKDGMTVFASTDDGQHAVLVRALMPMRAALLSICHELDAMPGKWFVDCISTPTTIYRDIQRDRVCVGTWGESAYRRLPEPLYLGSIGRGDLWRTG